VKSIGVNGIIVQMILLFEVQYSFCEEGALLLNNMYMNFRLQEAKYYIFLT
jgi:hypothetical protein